MGQGDGGDAGGGAVSERAAFLTGEWRDLAMLNYRVDPALLLPYVPRGTTLDAWGGATYLSVVGFMFRRTRVLGVPVPWHRTFEEVNLRFYVRREVPGETRRAVTFIREIVPRRAIALVARLAYHEPYVARPMRHSLERASGHAPMRVSYEWRQGAAWSGLAVECRGPSREIEAGSEEEFITEHYWGYTRQRDGGTVEYRVTHPRWRVWTAERATLGGDLEAVYGKELAAVLAGAPSSAFLADGSEIAVHLPRRVGK
jgi:uncharacterized protein YqjF (DUF2071 family)